jgi:hypothetical protein
VPVEIACRSAPVVAYDPRVPHITQFSTELGWSLRPGASEISELGWRLPSYAHAKSPGRFRIVCIGDSTTFGVGCTWKDAWARQLETLLNLDPDWTRSHGVTEVLNLGVLMYGPDQSLLVLRNHGLSFSPDLVIFHLCVDDFADASFDYYWKMNFNTKMYKPYFVLKDGMLTLGRERTPPMTDPDGNPAESPRQIFPELQLRLFSFLRTRAGKTFVRPAQAPEPRPTKAHWPIHDGFRAEYAEARPLVWAIIDEMARLCRKAGAQFLLTLSPHHMSSAEDIPPWRVASFRGDFQEFARAAEIPALDCVSEYFIEGGNARYQLDGTDNYLNSDGNSYIARTTLGRLKGLDRTAGRGPMR